METGSVKKTTHETEVVAGLRVVESEVRIDRPIFVDMEVKIPKFVEEQVKIPTGWDKVINEIALEISKGIYKNIEGMLNKQIAELIENRIKEIEVPRITYKDEVVVKNVEVKNAVVSDVHVTNAVITDIPVKNAVVENVNIKNAIITDVPVTNAVVSNVPVTNAIIKDIEVQNAILKHKTVDVIHPRYIDLQGKEIPVGT